MLFVYKVKYLFAYIPQMYTYSLNRKLQIACLTPPVIPHIFAHLLTFPFPPQLNPSMWNPSAFSPNPLC